MATRFWFPIHVIHSVRILQLNDGVGFGHCFDLGWLKYLQGVDCL